MTSEHECIATIALTQVPGIGRMWAKKLIDYAGTATDVFRLRGDLPGRLPGITARVVAGLDCPAAFARAQQEYEFAQKNKIQCIPLTDEHYPARLRDCDDAPTILFFKGNADLNPRRVINMVGTRNASDYGKQLCVSFLRDLKTICPDVLVVSGLAYGIDIHVHRAALLHNLPTVAVLAHGLDRIYPSQHRKTAVEMLDTGGLLTEFLTGTNPDKHNFVSRNRIVAGMSDATIVVESAAKGGSLITADIAGSYHRDCFAFPGRTTDDTSIGCNQLIRDNKASLLLSAEEFVNTMGWDAASQTSQAVPVQRRLFLDLSAEEQLIIDTLQKQDVQINTLVVNTNIPVHRMNALLFELEMKGIVRVLAGGMYQLIG